MSRRPVPRSLVWSMSFLGVLVGHALTYVVVAQTPGLRSTMLASTGHRYLPVATDAALALGVIGLAAAFLGRLGRDRDAAPLGALMTRVATFQVLTFMAIEAAERISAGAPLHDLTHVLPVGVLAQCVVAAAMSVVIRLVLGAADVAAEALDGISVSPPGGMMPLILAPVDGVSFHDRPVRRVRGPPS